MEHYRKKLYIAAYLVLAVFSITPCFSGLLINSGFFAKLDYAESMTTPSILYWCYLAFIIVINLLTLVCSMALFADTPRDIFSMEVLVPTAMFMTCPYKIYVYFRLQDMLLAIIIALLPLTLFFVKRIVKSKAQAKKILFMALSVSAVAGISVIVCSSMYVERITHYVGLTPKLRPGDFFSSLFLGHERTGFGYGIIIAIAAIAWNFIMKDNFYNIKRVVIGTLIIGALCVCGMFISGFFVLVAVLAICLFSKNLFREKSYKLCGLILFTSVFVCIFNCNYISYSSIYYVH